MVLHVLALVLLTLRPSTAPEQPCAASDSCVVALGAASTTEACQVLIAAAAIDPSDLAAALDRALGESQTVRDDERQVNLLNALSVIHERRGQLEASLSTQVRLARHHLDRSRFEVGREVLERVQPIAATHGFVDVEADAWIGLGDVFRDRDDYAKAMDAVARAEVLARRGPVTSGRLLRVLNARGVLARNMGDLSAAGLAYEEALQLATSSSSPATVGRSYNNLGVVRAMQGDFRAALSAFEQSLVLRERVQDDIGIAQSLTNIGGVHREQGQLDLAADYLGRSLAARERIGDRQGVALSAYNLGEIEHLRGDDTTAEALMRRGHDLATTLGLRVLAAQARESLGGLALAQGRLDEARSAFASAVTDTRALGNRAALASALVNEARATRMLGDFDAASRSLDEALLLVEAQALEDLRWQVHHEVGQIAVARGQAVDARAAFEHAVESIEVIRAGATAEAHALTGVFALRRAPYLALLELSATQGDALAAVRWAERARARVLADVLRAGKVRATRRLSQEQIDRERALEDQVMRARDALARARSARSPDASRVGLLEAELSAAMRDAIAFDTALNALSPAVRAARADTAIPPETLLAELRIAATDALLYYAVAERDVWLFVVRAHEGTPTLRAFRLPMGPAMLTARLTAFRQALASRDPGFAALATELHRTLVAPAASALVGATQLTVFPDAALWEIPFQALRDDRGRYLVERHSVSYGSSLAVWKASQEAAPRAPMRGSLFAMGNPMLPSTLRVAQLGATDRALAETGRLMNGLRAQYGTSAKIFDRALASETRFKHDASGYAIMHLATHGIVDPVYPLYSHVVLAPGDASEDGRLDARELLQVSLDTDLLILSACETGRGATRAGEGVIGLAWAAAQAGARSVLVSQWQVDAASSTDLMLAAHAGLRAGRSPADALRGAMRAVARDPSYRHPYYWAGYVVIGDAQSPISVSATLATRRPAARRD